MSSEMKILAASELKKVKNTVIGNPQAKANLVADERFVQRLIDCLDPTPSRSSGGTATSVSYDSPQPPNPVDARTEAAHIVASLSYGSEPALLALLRFNAIQALVYALSNPIPADPISLSAAYARALRALVSSAAETVGPSEYGLRPETTSTLRLETKEALDYIFELDTLDIVLPLLLSPSAQMTTPIVQLIASATRSPLHRSILAAWLPPDERRKEQGKTRKRGWEKIASPVGPPPTAPSWLVRVLVSLLSRTRDAKLQEAALLALAALAKENPSVALSLSRGSWYHPDVVGPPLVLIHSLSKSRNIEVQLAACLCATYIIRASNAIPVSNNFAYKQSVYAQIPLDDGCVRAVLNMVNRVVSEGSGESVEKRVRGCFILYHLTTDDRALCELAFERGCLDALAGVVKGITPVDPVAGWDENEAEGIARLREASLTAIATLALFSMEIRRAVTDTHGLLPYISTALKQGITTQTRNWNTAGVRYAGCQCVRVLSRAVAVLRTNIVDSGLGMEVFKIVVRPSSDGEPEDRRVLNAALAAICNIVPEFSPLRPIYLEQGLMPRLVQILHSGDAALRLNTLWAVKNLLTNTSTETKRDVMSQLGWRQLFELLHDGDLSIQEQAYNIVRNLAESEEGIEMVFSQMGGDAILDSITEAISLGGPLSGPSTPISPAIKTSELSDPSSTGSPVTLTSTPHLPVTAIPIHDRTPTITTAVYALANLCNAPHHLLVTILEKPQLLLNLRTCLAECGSEVRRGAVSCVLSLARQHPKGRKALVDAGVVGTLRRLCEWVPTSSSGSGAIVTSSGIPDGGVVPLRLSTSGHIANYPSEYPPGVGATRPSRNPARYASASHADGSGFGSWGPGPPGSARPQPFLYTPATDSSGGAAAGSSRAYRRSDTNLLEHTRSVYGSSMDDMYMPDTGPGASGRRGFAAQDDSSTTTTTTTTTTTSSSSSSISGPTPPISAATLAAAAAMGMAPPPGMLPGTPPFNNAPTVPSLSTPQMTASLIAQQQLLSHQYLHQQQQHQHQQMLAMLQYQQVRAGYAQQRVLSGASQLGVVVSSDDYLAGAGIGVVGAGASVIGGVGGGALGGGARGSVFTSLDVDREVYENARRALDWLEHGDGYAL